MRRLNPCLHLLDWLWFIHYYCAGIPCALTATLMKNAILQSFGLVIFDLISSPHPPSFSYWMGFYLQMVELTAVEDWQTFFFSILSRYPCDHPHQFVSNHCCCISQKYWNINITNWAGYLTIMRTSIKFITGITIYVHQTSPSLVWISFPFCP